MDWNQIEKKWALMARRVRADVQCANLQERMALLRNRARPEGDIVVDEITVVTVEATRDRSPAST